LLLVGLFLGACGSTKPKTVLLPPVTVTPAAPQTEEPPPQPRQEADVEGEEPDELTILIEPGLEEEEKQESLAEAARAERERRRNAPPPTIVITNQNLEDHATGDLTEVEGPPAPAEPIVHTEAEETFEAYWRDRIREARSHWGSVEEEIDHLNARIAELRQRFYAEDDPFYRDSQIKPAWDRALERLEEARAEMEDAEAEVERVLEEGRRAGALPGWLREGIELEPEKKEDEGFEVIEHQPQEPTIVVEDEEGDPR
jgi:hypothetical protein